MNPELEELQRKKTDLENELQSLSDQEKSLDDKIKTLEEKVAIQELDAQIKAKRDAVNQFETKVKELEDRLKAPGWKPEPPVQQQDQPQEPEFETLEEAPSPEMQDEIVLMEPGMESESPKTESSEPKKKRKFF